MPKSIEKVRNPQPKTPLNQWGILTHEIAASVQFQLSSVWRVCFLKCIFWRPVFQNTPLVQARGSQICCNTPLVQIIACLNQWGDPAQGIASTSDFEMANTARTTHWFGYSQLEQPNDSDMVSWNNTLVQRILQTISSVHFRLGNPNV